MLILAYSLTHTFHTKSFLPSVCAAVDVDQLLVSLSLKPMAHGELASVVTDCEGEQNVGGLENPTAHTDESSSSFVGVHEVEEAIFVYRNSRLLFSVDIFSLAEQKNNFVDQLTLERQLFYK